MDAVKQFRRATPKLQLALFLILNTTPGRRSIREAKATCLNGLKRCTCFLRLTAKAGAYKRRRGYKGNPYLSMTFGQAAEEIQTVTDRFALMRWG
jgi:hypothetical protein